MKYTICLLTFLLVGLFACQNADKQTAKKTDTKAKTTANTNQPVAKAGAINPDIKPLLQRLLPQCQKIEYVFYKQGMSFSTEVGDPKNVLAYYNYISDQEVAKHNCKYDGGAVFRGPEGDIVMTVDFVLLDNKCKSFVLTAEGKSYYQKIEDAGMKHLMFFYNIDQQQGALTPK